VPVVLVTGMSGTGKSTALAELARRGHRVVDTDYGGLSEEVPPSDGREREQLWREDRIDALLNEHDDDGVLFISGCVTNQGKFFSRFDAVVLLSAPADLILERLAVRKTNDFGKTDAERDLIVHDLVTVEQLLRTTSTAEIDTRAALDEVVDAIERISKLPNRPIVDRSRRSN
jgi:broad-specificity NMP kinase